MVLRGVRQPRPGGSPLPAPPGGDDQVKPAAILLTGIVGSTAYGLAGPGSDIDRVGVYAAPTLAFHGLHPPVDKAGSIISSKPDQALHEALKFARLCLSGNPTVM